MSGFSGIFLFDQKLSDKIDSFLFPEKLQGHYCQWQKVTYPDFILRCYNNGKFVKDSVVLQQDKKLVGFDGINLTNTRFEGINNLEDFTKAISSTNGSFTGIYKEVEKQELSLFNDQTGSRQLFYYWSPSFFAFSSSIFLLTDILRHFDIQPTLSIPASYMMLSFGYLLEDYTLVSEIKKITAGHYLTANKTGVEIKEYHNYYREIKHNQLTDELLEEIDNRFRKSIDLEYEKDNECMFNHLATLSGGLDSRLNVMLAHKYGFDDIVALTFSEGFKSDELTARKISNDLSLKHIILLLNNGFQLYDIETPLILNNCSVYYFGAAQTLAAVKRLNFSDYGLFHNGGLAESSKGGYLSGKEQRLPVLDKRYAVSDKLFDRIGPELLRDIFNRYQTDEMFITYNRGFNAIHNGLWMTMPFTDSVSTYMNINFADLAYSIHPKLRYNGFLTVEWIKRLHPELGDYPWRRGLKPTNNRYKKLFSKINYRLKLILTRNQDTLVPFNKWYYTSPKLQQFVTNQFENSVSWNIIPDNIAKDVRELFSNGSVTEKFLCISYLKSLELLFKR